MAPEPDASASMARILLLEDDNNLSSLLTGHLQALHYGVTACGDGQEGLDLVRRQQYDLLILDLGLPGLDGLEVCRRVRQQNALTPILMLTARNSEIDRVIGLELGADDYLGKPFSLHELQARIRAILRRQHLLNQNGGTTEQQIHHGDLTIDAARREVRLHNKVVHLTTREFDLLHFLASSPGKVYNRDQLLDRVWGYTNSNYEHTVNSNINRLRSKIEADTDNPVYIITVRGVGYKFNPDHPPQQLGT